ncbi:hypothetical protein ENUP19_0003G0044 [Entamoeba nuttalli]|uniref:RNA recognition motif domain containing protein n=2 Tax=Entamoeba nuttalli TaxID=412467 RepID=K2GFC1_ENTNP|nr:RNA recognition motif domain containing protein [Entamoeba nuttalli P19]EKE41361.1 RNA recognition motif domain containing protein [Entamoeba nuttalli P19]|eukprot:XP_008856297.1 RNA recognition motif domain containing protein [Entamoeba nuttalli P19]
MSLGKTPRYLSFEINKSINEHQTHTLFISNINSEVSSEAYYQLLESFGEIEAISFETKSRGFIIVTYYDIRSAKIAIKILQKTVIGNQALEVHYTISRDKNQINHGSIVVFNLDETITNTLIHQIFSQFGEIKDIRQTPNKKHHRFIEFFDSRSAEKALKTMNKSELNGKKLKIEFSRPGGRETGFITEELIERYNNAERQRAQSDPCVCLVRTTKQSNNGDSLFTLKQRQRAQTSIRLKHTKSSLVEFQEYIDCETPQENSLFSRTPEQLLSDNTMYSDTYDNNSENICL